MGPMLAGGCQLRSHSVSWGTFRMKCCYYDEIGGERWVYDFIALFLHWKNNMTILRDKHKIGLAKKCQVISQGKKTSKPNASVIMCEKIWMVVYGKTATLSNHILISIFRYESAWPLVWLASSSQPQPQPQQQLSLRAHFVVICNQSIIKNNNKKTSSKCRAFSHLIERHQ